MSIEQAIAELTAALKENSELLRKRLSAKPEPVEEPEPEPVEEPEPEPVAEPVSYPAVQDAVLAYATAKGKDATLRILAQFGVTTATKLAPEQYAAVVTAFGEAT